MSFNLTVLCTGNICRSPIAEALLRFAFREHQDITIRSAGLQAALGRSITPDALDILRHNNLLGEKPLFDPNTFHATQITAQEIKESDLVLVMTTEHRTQTVALAPAALKRTFTLKEAATLASAITVEDLLARTTTPQASDLLALITETLPLVRSEVDPAALAADSENTDIADPYGRPPEEMERAYHHIATAIGTVVGLHRKTIQALTGTGAE